jgi:hypothetical protein
VFKRCEKKNEESAPKFIPSSSYHKEEKELKPTKTHYPSNAKPSFNPKKEVKRETTKSREESFTCLFGGRVGHFDYVRNSYRDEFIDFPPLSYSRALPQFSYGPNHRSYSFGSRENRIAPRRLGYGTHPHCGDHFSCGPDFSGGASHSQFELRHLDGPYFSHLSSHATGSNGEVMKDVKTSSGRMVKFWISKIYLTNTSTEPSTFSHPM